MGKEGGGEEEAAEMTSSARPTLLAMDIILTLLILIAPGLLSLVYDTEEHQNLPNQVLPSQSTTLG